MKVLLTCGGGMSTAILAKNLEKFAKADNIELKVNAVGFELIENHLQSTSDYDLILVAPQIKHKFQEIQTNIAKYDIEMKQIEPMEYAPIGAKKLYQRVIK